MEEKRNKQIDKIINLQTKKRKEETSKWEKKQKQKETI